MSRLRHVLLTIVMLGLLALPFATMARGGTSTVWRSKTVRVRIYTTANWHPLIARTIADYNAIMPQRGPTLVASIQPERSCTWVRKQRFRKPTITICSQPDGDGRGTTVYRADHGTFARKRVKINLVGDPGHDRYAPTHQNVVCHELLHAIAGASHENLPDAEERSCLLGTLDAPGAWDVAYLERVYAKKAKRHKHR